MPAEPTAAERAAHALTHLPFQPWCADPGLVVLHDLLGKLLVGRVSGTSKENPHRCRSAEEAEHAVGAVAKALQGHVGARRLQMRRPEIAVRSVHRLPKPEQIGSDLMRDMRGLPWEPGDGKVSRDFPSCGHASVADRRGASRSS